MRKVLLVLLWMVSMFGMEIKDSYFIGGGKGLVLVNKDNTKKNDFIEFKVGRYFYDSNIYNISNRIYLGTSRVLADDISFYTANINLDWIKPIGFLGPFLGLNIGYIYYSENDKDYSSANYGINFGVLFYIGGHFEFEVSAGIDTPTDKNEKLNSNIKKGYAGVNISF